jgi:hypothetical protein
MQISQFSTGTFQPLYLESQFEIDPEPNGREGGDDALAGSSPNDLRSDEKVIVNEQRSNKTVNAPSQTASNSSEESSVDDEIIDKEKQERKK